MMPSYLQLVNGRPEPRNHCRGILERAGYRIAHVPNAADAATMAAREKPLAIIIEAEGRDLAHRLVRPLRLHPRTVGVPILVLSPAIDRRIEDHFDRNGVRWLPEPYTARRLLDEVQYVTTPARSGWGVQQTHEDADPSKTSSSERRRWTDVWHDERMRETWGSLGRYQGRRITG